MASIMSVLTGAKAIGQEWKQGITNNLSIHDKLAGMNKPLADRLFTNSVDNIGDSADSYAHAAKLAGDERLRLFYDTLDKHSGMQSLAQTLWPPSRKAGMAQRASLENETMLWLNKSYVDELNGMKPQVHPNPAVEDLANSYRKSGYARDMLARRQRAGEDGAKGITPSDNYVPQTWDYHKFVRSTGNDKAKIDAMARAFGDQIAAAYPGLVRAGLSTKQIGKSFLKTQRDKITLDPNSPLKGVNMQSVMAILEGEIKDPAILATLKTQLAPSVSQAGKQANTKSRIAFDVNKQYVHDDGSLFKLGDVMDTRMQHTLESYNLNAAARIGLAKKGFASSDAFMSELNAILKKFEGDPAKHAEAKAFLDNIGNDLLNRPTGEALGDWMRTGQVFANALYLKRSGLYNFVDYARSAQRHGYMKVIGGFLPAFKGAMSTIAMNPTAARTITDIIHGQLTGNGRMLSVIRHTDDNFAAPLTMFHGWVQTAGQSVRFLNGSEILRRQHIRLITNLQADMLNDLAKGVESSTKYLKSINVDDATISQIKQSVTDFGLYTDKWDQALVDKMTTILMHDVDNMALMLKRGETPHLMRYSVAGKILFPFFSFSAAANQKILRQSMRSDGPSGVAITMSHQASIAVVVAAAANVMDGKEWDQDIAKRAVLLAPGLGYAGYFAGMLNQGKVGSDPTVFALPNSADDLAKAVGEGDFTKAATLLPGAAVFPGTSLLHSTFKDD